MEGFIDIHSHILPAVDDGSKDMAQTINMLKMAYDSGTRIIIATPHFIIGRKNSEVSVLKDTFERVKEEAKKIGNDFEIYLGNEIFYSDDILEALNKKRVLTMADSRYVLIEFMPQTEYKSIEKALKKVILEGYIPITAHAERYACLVKNPDLVYDLIEIGAYIQLNTASFVGGFMDKRAKFCKKLLKNNIVHFLGTDAHSDVGNRIPVMTETVDLIIKKYGEQTAETLLKNNPKKILQNNYL